MKKLINKIKEVFNKPKFDKKEILELIMMEASMFEPDWIDGKKQSFAIETPYKGGFIYLRVYVKVEFKESYFVIYNDPIHEPEYSIFILDSDFELWDKHGSQIENIITIDEIKQALSPIEIIN